MHLNHSPLMLLRNRSKAMSEKQKGFRCCRKYQKTFSNYVLIIFVYM